MHRATRTRWLAGLTLALVLLAGVFATPGGAEAAAWDGTSMARPAATSPSR